MEIKKELTNNTLIIKLSGRLDSVTSSNLENELNDLTDVKELIFDLKDLSYVSSAGLRIFLKTKKAMKDKGEIKLINVCSFVKEVLDFTGFSDILIIE